MTKPSLKDVTPAYQALGLKSSLAHAVTRWDRIQETKRYYNIYALPIYLSSATVISERVDSGEALDVVLSDCLCGPLELFVRKFLHKAGYECSPARHPSASP